MRCTSFFITFDTSFPSQIEIFCSADEALFDPEERKRIERYRAPDRFFLNGRDGTRKNLLARMKVLQDSVIQPQCERVGLSDVALNVSTGNLQ